MAVRRLYGAADFPEPRRILWFDSPFSASWVVALLIAPHHQLWSQRLSSGLSRDDRDQLDRARSALGSALGKPLQVVDIPAAARAGAFAQAGLPLSFAELVAELCACFESGRVRPQGDRVLHATTPIEDVLPGILRMAQ